MPNRILKESICTSDNLNDLKPEEEIFFYRLIVNCDDYGLSDARTQILRARCFPLKADSVKETDIEKWLKALVKSELIVLYEVDGKRYLKMVSWENHQQVRAKKSKYPQPDSSGNHLISDDDICPRNPIQSNPNPIQSNPNPIQSESESESESVPYAEIVSFLNEQAGTAYKPSTKATRSHIHARWDEGYRLEHFRIVIEKKCRDWIGTDQAKYLRPETLFGTKFEGYLNQPDHGGRASPQNMPRSGTNNALTDSMGRPI